MKTSTFIATGMTCQHCVASVTKEVSELAQVTDVSVDLSSGKVTVTSHEDVSAEQIIAAIDRAGYSAVLV
jgi:copper ion binding protein